MYFNKNILRIRIVFYSLGAIIAFGTLIYTTTLFGSLQIEEMKKVHLFAKALKSVSKPNASEGELALFVDILEMNKNIPILIFDENDNLIDSKNIRFHQQEKKLPKASLLRRKKMEKKPLKINIRNDNYQYIYRGYSPKLRKLEYMPILQLLLIILLAFIAYILFRNKQESNQNQVWAGLSKETAHQLGTPISSLMAWVELLKTQNIAPNYIPEIQKDIDRLKIISNRFSHIGSIPQLSLQNIIPLIDEIVNYTKLRTSKFIEIHFDKKTETINAEINKELFSWIFENLTKNAVDAIVNKGQITILAEEYNEAIYIDVQDTGKGIPPKSYKKIFQPGYSTKKRGWGLGLSLAKRIVEDFHNGRIFVKNSEPGNTVFRIILPKTKKEDKKL